MGSLIFAIISVALGVATTVAQEIISNNGSGIRNQAYSIINELKSIMSKDQSFKEQLQQAYSDRNTSILTSMAYGKGFGPRFESLNKALKANTAAYKQKAAEVDSHYQRAANAADELSTKSAYAGSTISTNVAGRRQNESGSQQLSDLKTNDPTSTSAESVLISGGVSSGQGGSK